MATAENRRRPIDPYYDLTDEAGRLTFHRLFNEELTTMGDHRRLKSKNDVRAFAVFDFEKYFKEADCHDALIPYTAITFVDRFLSKERIPKVIEGKGNNRRLFLTCCLTISWKLRNKHFHAATFLEKNNMDFSGEQLVEMESEICRVLDWRLNALMPFRFLDFFEPFVTLPPPRTPSAPLRPVYKLLIKAQYDVAFTKFRPSIMAASALLIFISNEFPSQLRDLESNLIRGFFYPQFQKTIKKCQKKLAPLYGGSSSGITDSPLQVGAATSSSAAGDQGVAPSSSGAGDQEEPLQVGAATSSSAAGDQGVGPSSSGAGDQEELGFTRREGKAPIDDDAGIHTLDRVLFDMELEWQHAMKNSKGGLPKCCQIL